MKRVIIFLTLFVTILSPLVHTTQVSATAIQGWDPGYIINDSVFTNNRSMSYDEIRNFLASKVPVCDTWGTKPSEYGGGTRAQYAASRGYSTPLICLKDYVENGRSSAQIIYDTAQAFRINPQVLIVLLQKEQGIVTDDWPLPSQYRTATGYGCPDTSACDSQYYGLTNQLQWSARMFRAIMDASPTWYTPYVTGNNYIKYHPDFWNSSTNRWEDRCGGTTVNIINRATQALYNYTPYQPNRPALDAGYGSGDGCSAYGNRNFYQYFKDWFGSPRGDYCTTNMATSTSDVLFREQRGQVSTGNFTLTSGASTGCIEFHGWNSGMRSWKYHTPSNQSSINTSDSMITFADLDGDGKDEALLVGLKNTGSGRIEVHVWSESLREWRDHIITNSSTINPLVSSVAFSDVNGDGKDEGILIGQGNGSTTTGRIEMHVWNYGFQSWRDHIITNSSTLDPGISSIQYADIDGDGKDEGILIGQGNGSTSTGRIEMHVWNYGFQSWRDHIITNSSTLDPSKSSIRFTDMNGDNRDEGVLMGKYAPTGSNKIEVHVWNYGFQSWRDHIITNQDAPNQ